MEGHPTYVLYLESDLNRVFSDTLDQVAAAELAMVAERVLGHDLGPIESVTNGRTRFLRFPTSAPPAQLAALAGQLSASAALFRERPDGSDILLEPLTITERLAYGTELVTTQRYRGKTNERLTRAMLNLALAAAGIDPSQPAGTLLDPLCGRGTTLNWALAYGLDAIGIEIDPSSLDQHRTFLQTWAKRQRLPHKAVRHHDGNAEGRCLTLRIAPDRARLDADEGQRIETFSGDGADAGHLIRAGAADAIVTDLPYGVQHAGRQGSGRSGGRSGRKRAKPEPIDPRLLLERALPAWHRWLRVGGGLALAWNAKQTPRRTVVRAIREAGFEVASGQDGHSMAHTVDATIDRDVVVAHRSE